MTCEDICIRHKAQNLLVLSDKLLDESGARFVRFFSNGMDCGIHVVVID
jgi:hypothetical protein